jgi:TatA/E family protein of Tat protein translocase
MVGAQDLLIGLVLAAFFFGAKRLPEVARALGQAVGEFRKSVSEDPGADDPAPSAPVEGRACGRCRTALEPDWTHCPRCGTALTVDAPPAAPSPPDGPGDPTGGGGR